MCPLFTAIPGDRIPVQALAHFVNIRRLPMWDFRIPLAGPAFTQPILW
jgi:hypothetical protein